MVYHLVLMAREREGGRQGEWLVYLFYIEHVKVQDSEKPTIATIFVG